jgi:hypothetical protein
MATQLAIEHAALNPDLVLGPFCRGPCCVPAECLLCPLGCCARVSALPARNLALPAVPWFEQTVCLGNPSCTPVMYGKLVCPDYSKL